MTETTVNLEMTEERVKSNPLSTVWLMILGFILGMTLLSSAILLAWPIVARYAATLH